MSLEEMELNVGGTSFKGVWIAVILSFGSTLGGGIWKKRTLSSSQDSKESRRDGRHLIEE